MIPSITSPKTPFVGRSIELQKLQYFLDIASQGKPQVCFVVGEAGSGKSTLVEKFLLESQKKYDSLIFAVGECSGQGGPLDPYLPFKAVIRSFIQTLDETKNKKQEFLKKFSRLSAQTLIEVAPDLIGNLVPGGVLLAKGLNILIDKTKIGSEILADKTSKKYLELSDNQISQSEICQQYTLFLQAISKNHTIILVIEDLHWADQSTINLLFHLVRSLKEGHVLVLGTYRPEDIKIGSDNTRHPLDSVLNEIKRYRGDVWIDLNEVDDAKRIAFVNDLIDAEPNKLSDQFRKKFFELTEGNALFATELLYYMKENGFLENSNDEGWFVQREVDWDHVPSRVEAVIKERVDRVGDELKKILTIASVEGENFTAQVIGRLEEVSDRLILERLSSQLSKRHHLVDEESPLYGARNDLAFFKFSHSLVQQYIYNEIGVSEKRMLHKNVAEALERLYGEDIQTIAPQLARHFEEAREHVKAAHYYMLAGDKAISVSSFQEAKVFFEHAISFGLVDDEKILQRKLGIACFGLGLLEKARLSFEQSIKISNELQDPLHIAECEAWLARVLVDVGDFKHAKAVVEHGLTLAESSDVELFAHLLNELAYVNMSLELLDIAEELNRKSYEICEEKGLIALSAKVLYDLGCCLHVKGNISESINVLNKGISIAQASKARSVEAYCYNELGWVNYDAQNYDIAKSSFNSGLLMGERLDNKWLRSEAFNGLGFCACAQNGIQDAELLLKQSLRIGDEINGMTETLLILVGFANIYLKKNEIHNAHELVDIALNHPCSDYEIKHFARKTLVDIKIVDPNSESSIENVEVRYRELVQKLIN